MCLIVVAWQQHPMFDVLLAANRDEYHDRPAEPAHWWSSPAGLFAGRDAKAGGAWCGADRQGRFAAVTNVRAPGAVAGARSRGELVRDYFAVAQSAERWAGAVASCGASYSPFNLLVGDRHTLWFVSNHDTTGPRRVAPGIVAVSNGHWGEHWPKTDRAEAGMADRIARDEVSVASCMALMADAEPAAPRDLPDTGIAIERERFLSPAFIRSARYGTRATTVLHRRAGRSLSFVEQGFDPDGQAVHRVQQSWPIETCST